MQGESAESCKRGEAGGDDPPEKSEHVATVVHKICVNEGVMYPISSLRYMTRQKNPTHVPQKQSEIHDPAKKAQLVNPKSSLRYITRRKKR
ncbi:hypothetical protein B14911_02539, partial [Bacillus sp. NRRL B-14911]